MNWKGIKSTVAQNLNPHVLWPKYLLSNTVTGEYAQKLTLSVWAKKKKKKSYTTKMN